jgi:hypothetical protein
MEGRSGRYEFSPAENEVLSTVTRWTGLLAWILMGCTLVLAVGALITGEAGAIGSLIVAAMYFIVGLNLRGAAGSLAAVIDTSGNDVDHLMDALAKLGSTFRLMAITLLVGAVVFVVAVVSISTWMASLQQG